MHTAACAAPSGARVMRIVGQTEMARRKILQRMATVVVAISVSSLPVVSKCVEYDPAKVSLQGNLVRQTFAGPPNYESIASGDRPETYWFLELEIPICVIGKNEQSPDSETEDNVRVVQLNVDPDVYKSQRALLGKRVVVSGRLSHGIAGHHHTRVLLDVSSLEKAP